MRILSILPLTTLLALAAIPVHAAQKRGLAPGTPLVPVRKAIEQSDYTVDTVADKRQKAEDKVVRMDLRITGSDKKPIKPAAVFLVGPDDKKVDADDRDDHDVGNEENSGLPLSVSPGVNGYGGTSVGVGLNLNKLFSGGGTYSYSRIDFLRKDFVAGVKLKIILRDKTELAIPLTSIGKVDGN